ncbi:MAG: hypothetical protein IKC04_08990, partial [Oscillospiraceae bacterium]|nr:hypothetical protein [Oscillospiraceae bacterium]
CSSAFFGQFVNCPYGDSWIAMENALSVAYGGSCLAAAHVARTQRERQETIGAAGDKKDALRVQRVRKGFGISQR